MKWGEHSNDVQFILQWSPLDSATKAAAKSSEAQGHMGLSKATNNGGTTPVSSPVAAGDLDFSPITRSSTASLSPTKSLGHDFGFPSGTMSADSCSASAVVSNKKKDLSVTSRGGLPSHRDLMMSSSSGCETGVPYNGKVMTHKNSSGNLPSEEPEFSNRKLKDLNISSPPPYRDPPTPGRSQSGNGSSLKELPPYRDPPPPNPTSRSHLQRIVNNHSPVSSSSVSGSICSSIGNRASPVLFNGSSINGVGGSSSGNTVLSKDSAKFMSPSQHSLSSSSQPSDTTDSQMSWKNKVCTIIGTNIVFDLVNYSLQVYRI